MVTVLVGGLIILLIELMFIPLAPPYEKQPPTKPTQASYKKLSFAVIKSEPESLDIREVRLEDLVDVYGKYKEVSNN